MKTLSIPPDTAETAADLVQILGRKALIEALGVTTAAITNNIRKGSFPSHWYLTIKDLCMRSGIVCPDRLFRMSRVGVAKPGQLLGGSC